MSEPKNRRELPTERLATTDLKGERVYLYPADVKGRYQRMRFWVQHALVFVFLALPWLRLNGKQAFLIDLENRRFHIFGLTLWAHETPLLLLVLIAFVAIIAWITARLGRAWCGWACPQTVFIERWFRAVERLIEGDAVERKRLDEAPPSIEKFAKKALKWAVFVALSGVITHSVLALFVGSERVLEFISTSPSEHMTPFLFVVISSAIILFDFGWFREQFCIIACPYGRMQSALMDTGSLALLYDEKRGEPRGKGGDCVNCYRCVQVCPTGVDIRRGVQLECIACTACADACDTVMERLKKPKGLIRYARETELDPKAAQPSRNRPRLYAAVLVLAVTSAGVLIARREPIRSTLLRTHGIPIPEAGSDGIERIANSYQWVIENQSDHPTKIEIDEALVQAEHPELDIRDPQGDSVLNSGERQTRPLWIRAPRSAFNDRTLDLELPVRLIGSTGQTSQMRVKVRLLGPLPKRLPD